MSAPDDSLRPKDPLIEAATRLLSANPEQHLAAAGFLESIRKPDPQAEQAILARWAAVDGRRRLISWKTALGLLVGLAAVTTALVDWRDVRSIVRPYDDERDWETTQDEFEANLARQFTAEQKILMFGDPSTRDPVKRSEALWKSEPDNPAFLAEHFNALTGIETPISADLRDHAKRIDPDNAWFTYIALVLDSRDCVERIFPGSKSVAGKWVKTPAAWKIKDQARLDRILTELKAARGQQRFEHYDAALMRQRIPLLRDENIEERRASTRYLRYNAGPRSSMVYGLVGVFSARAWQTGEAGDVEAYRELSADTRHFIRALCSGEPVSVFNELWISSNSIRLANQFMEAAYKLGLNEEAEEWRQMHSKLKAWSSGRSGRGIRIEGKSHDAGVLNGVLRYGDLAFLSSCTEADPKLSDSDIRPGRLIDHEIASRFSAYAVFSVLLVLVVLISFYRVRFPKMIRVLAVRLQELLRPVDWIWICTMGLVLPLLFVLVINRCTPFGGRDYGLSGSYLILPAGHFLAVLLLWLTVPPVVIRWRLAKRAGALGVGNRIGWVSLVPVFFLMAFVPVVGWAATTGVIPGFWVETFDWISPTIDGRVSEFPLWMAAALLACPVLWILASAMIAFLVNGGSGLERLAITRAMLPVLAVGMLLSLSLVPFLKLAEQQWFSQDRLIKFDPAQPSWSRFEYQMAVQMRKELREILGISE